MPGILSNWRLISSAPVPCLDLRFKLLNFFIQYLKVLDQSLNKVSERDRQLVSRAFDYARESRSNVGDSFRHNQTKLGKQPSDLIGLDFARFHESLTRMMQGQHRLLFNILDRH
jgi:hypothetical protein